MPFQKELATQMGLMISDSVDGPFRLAVDWIELAPLSDRDESATAATEARRGREEEGMIED